MTKLDGIRLLEEGELAGHLTAILGRISRDESQRAMQEVLQLVVERLQTAGQADAKACIEVLEELACRGSVEAKYHLESQSWRSGTARRMLLWPVNCWSK